MSKKNRRKIRKVLVTLCCALLLVAVSVGATFAYLTKTTEVVTNTFTANANVNIDLKEAKVTNLGVLELGDDGNPVARVKANEYKLIPGHNYVKDPTIEVLSGSDDCWLYVKVENGISAIEATGDTTIAKQMEENGWTVVDAENYPGVYALEASAKKAGDKVEVFNSFTIAGNADISAYANATVKITAYAIQADGFATSDLAWAAAPLAAWKKA